MASLADAVAIFDATMRDMRAGDSMVLNFPGDTVDVRINGVEIEAIRRKAFQQALSAIWLGPKSIDRDTKEGMLGRGRDPARKRSSNRPKYLVARVRPFGLECEQYLEISRHDC